jgi:hypothetical protein
MKNNPLSYLTNYVGGKKDVANGNRPEAIGSKISGFSFPYILRPIAISL